MTVTTEQIRRQVFGEIEDPLTKAAQEGAKKSGSRWLLFVSYSIAMNSGLGAFLNSLGLGAIGGIFGVVGIVASLAGLGIYSARWAYYALTAQDKKQDTELMFRELLQLALDGQKHRVPLYIAALRAEEVDGSQSRDVDTVSKAYSFGSDLPGMRDAVEYRRRFFQKMRDVLIEGSRYNVWYESARALYSVEVTDIALRGLSPTMQIGNTEANAEMLFKLAGWKAAGEGVCPGRDLPPEGEEKVTYYSLSYKHDTERRPLTFDTALEACHEIENYHFIHGNGNSYRVWIDQLVHGERQNWANVGFTPYIFFPTYRSSSARRSTRSWIVLEEFCASIGPGLCEEIDEDSRILSSLLRETVVEANFAVAAVVYRGLGDGGPSDSMWTRNMREEDKQLFRSWSQGVLFARDLQRAFSTMRSDMASGNRLREFRRSGYTGVLFGKGSKTYLGREFQSGLMRGERRVPSWSAMEVLGYRDFSEEDSLELENRSRIVILEADQISRAIAYVITPVLQGTIVTRLVLGYEDHVRNHYKVIRVENVEREQMDRDLRRGNVIATSRPLGNVTLL